MPDLPHDWIGVAGLAILTIGGWLRNERHARTMNKQVKNGSHRNLRHDMDEILDGVRVIRGDVHLLNGRVTLIEKKIDL